MILGSQTEWQSPPTYNYNYAITMFLVIKVVHEFDAMSCHSQAHTVQGLASSHASFPHSLAS
jgi:hypothetical protein